MLIIHKTHGMPFCRCNHSCDPNCESDIIFGKVWINAMRDIHEGEELTINYNYELEGFFNRPCKCGSKNCLGFMVVNHQLCLKNPQKLMGTMMEMARNIKPQKCVAMSNR